MGEAPPSLDALHDIVVPSGVDLWPLAPGAQLLFLLLAAWVGRILWRRWKHQRANAYRKEALAELSTAAKPLEIAVILRRCARIHHSARDLSAMSSPEWLAFLEATGPSLPSDLKKHWEAWVYGDGSIDGVGPMKAYAADWIRSHRFPENAA